MKKIYILSILSAAAWLFAGCGETETGEVAASSAQADAVITTVQPVDAKPLGEIMGTAKPGDKVVVAGQIGGHIEPFGADYASIVLADTSIMFCDEMGDDDHCQTPWDACCENPDKVKNNRAMVQFLDAQGNPYTYSLKGQGGLKELDTVIVSGVVAEGSTAQNLVINGEQIYKVQL